MKARDLITSSLRLIGVLQSGEVPDADEASDGLMILNQMLDSWNAERLSVFTINRQEFTLVAGQQTYTLGAGGDFNVARPAKIENAGIISLNNPAQPLELPLEMLTDVGWAAIPVKNITSSLPAQLYDDGSFPKRSLSFWCIPSVQVKVALYMWQALTQFATLDTDVTYPPGYLKALRYNLAVDLAPEFDAQLNPVTAALAVSSKQTIQTDNTPAVEMRCDPMVVSPNKKAFNWITGE